MHYTGTIWRPPFEAKSLLIQVTAGCTHHECKFCTLYDDLPFKFRLSPLEEVEADLKEASNYFTKATRIFFTGANPFVLKSDKLALLANKIQQHYPSCESIGCFARITDIIDKSIDDLKKLKILGYDGLTIGIETGHDDTLAFMNKGYESKDIIEQCKKLDEAGIGYNFFYLTGISGKGKGIQGAEATAAVINQLKPKIVNANMLTIYNNSQLYDEIEAGNWEEASEIEKLIELRVLVQNINTNTYFATFGSSNQVQVYGDILSNKERLVSDLTEIINTVDESELRSYRENLRHL